MGVQVYYNISAVKKKPHQTKLSSERGGWLPPFHPLSKNLQCIIESTFLISLAKYFSYLSHCSFGDHYQIQLSTPHLIRGTESSVHVYNLCMISGFVHLYGIISLLQIAVANVW